MSSQNAWIWRTVELAYGESECYVEQTLLSKNECQILPTSSPIAESVIWKKPGSDPLADLREPPKRQQLGLTEGTQMLTAAILGAHFTVKTLCCQVILLCPSSSLSEPGAHLPTSRPSKVQEAQCHEVCHAGRLFTGGTAPALPAHQPCCQLPRIQPHLPRGWHQTPGP